MALRRDPQPRVVRRTLAADEHVVVSEHRHWAWLARPVAELVAGTALVLWLAYGLPDLGGLTAVLWWLWFALVIRTGWHLFLWWRQCFLVTTERIILVHGGLTITRTQLPLSVGKDITIRQNLFGQWLGFGDFILESAPKDSPLHEVSWLPDCERRHRDISRLIHGSQARHEGHSRLAGAQRADARPQGAKDTYDDTIVMVDETSRNKPQQVHRPAVGAQPITRGPGLLSLWRGIRSTMPTKPAAETSKRRNRWSRKARRDAARERDNRAITTRGKEPQQQSVLREL